MVNTTHFLNTFAHACETKLAKVSRDLDRVQVVLALLETKINCTLIRGRQFIWLWMLPRFSMPIRQMVVLEFVYSSLVACPVSSLIRCAS